VLLTAGDDPPTTTLVRAVHQWARAEQVRFDTVAVTPPKAVDGIVEAMNLEPDLVICAGSALVDALALVTASHLEQQFLVVGAQLPEPTVNVTAAIWRGASSRGREVPDTAASLDPAAFTPERADAAIRAGVASVLSDLTGIVIWLDEVAQDDHSRVEPRHEDHWPTSIDGFRLPAEVRAASLHSPDGLRGRATRDRTIQSAPGCECSLRARSGNSGPSG
jgi:hypothetical protein